MPVIFNEPLSFLQRVVEYMEYERLIERASASDDPIERHEVSCHPYHNSVWFNSAMNLCITEALKVFNMLLAS